MRHPSSTSKKVKRRGHKADDYPVVAFIHCHHEIDNVKTYTREERMTLMERAIVLILIQLAKMELVSLA